MTWIKSGSRFPLLGLAALYVMVGVVYAIITPMMEKPDEGGHYGYILYLREHRALPPLQPPSNLWSFEFKQPPLYYVITAALTTWMPDSPDLGQSIVPNPFMWESVPGYRNDNRNRYLHPPDLTPAFFGSRLVSMLFGLGTMLAAYVLASQMFDPRTRIPLAMAALIGFQPQFVYITTAVNNDAAAAFWGTLLVTLLVCRLKKVNLPHFALLLGGILGLASITKVSGLVFFPLVGLALLLIHRGLNRAFVQDGIVIVMVALLVGGWWYARNAIVYHDPFTLSAHHMQDPGLGATSSNSLKHTLISIEHTFWANQSRVFISPIAVDKLMIWWGRISLGLFAIGLVLNWRSFRADLPTWIVLLSWPVTFGVLLVGYWNQKFAWPFGRLLFPAIAPIALVLVLGWRLAFPPAWHRLSTMLSLGTVMVASSLIPFVSLYPLYHPSRVAQAEQVQRPVGTIYTDVENGTPIARLIGYNLPQPYALPGDNFPIELCWEPLGRTRRPNVMFVQLLDISRVDADTLPTTWGRRTTYPGLGSRATDRWMLHEAFCDTVLVPVFSGAPTPLAARIEVGFTDPENQDRLQAVDADSSPIALAVIGGVPILSPNEPLKAHPTTRYTLDHAIGLDQVQLVRSMNSITLTLAWQSLQSVSYDATMFVHVRRMDGSGVAQVDSQPLEGRFPTSYWLPGQTITDTVSITLPPDVDSSPLILNLGLYLWPTMQRLPVTGADGSVLADHAIVVEVQRP